MDCTLYLLFFISNHLCANINNCHDSQVIILCLRFKDVEISKYRKIYYFLYSPKKISGQVRWRCGKAEFEDCVCLQTDFLSYKLILHVIHRCVCKWNQLFPFWCKTAHCNLLFRLTIGINNPTKYIQHQL